MDDDADPSGRSLSETVGSNPAKGMYVCLLWTVVLSGGSLCDELITRPEESYWLMRSGVWSRNLKNEEAMVRIGPQRQKMMAMMNGRRKTSRSVYINSYDHEHQHDGRAKCAKNTGYRVPQLGCWTADLSPRKPGFCTTPVRVSGWHWDWE
jgi:hypothetical protein